MNKPRIVFVGHVCVDHNTVEGKTYTNWGSPAMFMCRYLQLACGLQPHIIASYGRDFAPFAASIQLHPAIPNLEHSLGYENIVIDGHRTQYCYHANTTLPPSIDTSCQRLLAHADIVFFAPLTPLFPVDYVRLCMNHVRRTSLRVLLPQGYMRHIDNHGLVSPRECSEVSDLAPLFDLITLSDEDHPAAIAQSHHWKQHSPSTHIIVTRNIRGADIITANGINHIPTTPVAPEDIIDSVGCGDVFTAATALCLFQTGDLPAAVQAGHTAARAKLLSLTVAYGP